MQAKHQDHVSRPALIWATIFITLAALVVLFLAGCADCRMAAIKDAERYQAQGKETQIACYYLNLDGLLWGAFVWKSHCQAQIKVGETWKWAGEFGGLRQEPTFRPRGEVYTWSLEGYKKLIKEGK